MIFGIGFSSKFLPKLPTFFASKFWPEFLFLGPFPEKRKTCKSSESFVKTIVCWHAALCNNGPYSKTHCRKNVAKNTTEKLPKSMQKVMKIRVDFENPCWIPFFMHFGPFWHNFWLKTCSGASTGDPGRLKGRPVAVRGGLGEAPGACREAILGEKVVFGNSAGV